MLHVTVLAIVMTFEWLINRFKENKADFDFVYVLISWSLAIFVVVFLKESV